MLTAPSALVRTFPNGPPSSRSTTPALPMKNRDGETAYLRDAATLDELIFHVANNVPAISSENITGLPRVVR